MTGILLQIMEEGELTDASGRRVSLKNAIIVMTSNLGGEQKGDGLGFQPAGRAGQTEVALRQAFSPEFLGRLDSVVHFSALSEDAMSAVAQKYLNQLQERARGLGVQLEISQELAAYLCGCCKSGGGARQLRRLIQEQLESPVARLLLKSAKKPTKIRVELEQGEAVLLI